MRHRVSGKHLGRTPSHRRALRRNLAASLFQHGAIRTTEAKAKELRRFAEKLITIARQGTLHARRQVVALLQDRAMTDAEGEFEEQTVIQKLFDEIAPRYEDRPGGYTRIIRLSDRRIGDAGTQVVLQLIEESTSAAAEPAKESRRKRRAAKRREAAGLPEREDEDAQPADEDEGAEDAEKSEEAEETEDAEAQPDSDEEPDEQTSSDDEDDQEQPDKE
jgi:large subunit ribosomal protein L17